MVKLFFKKTHSVLFTLLMLTFSIAGIAQSGCPSATNINAIFNLGSNQMHVQWSTSQSATNYLIQADFDTGATVSLSSSNSLVTINTPATFSSVEVTIKSVCGQDIGDAAKKEFYIITQGEVDQFCSDLLSNAISFAKGTMIVVESKLGLSEPMTVDLFVKLYCDGEGGSDVEPRLPAIEKEIKVVPNPIYNEFEIQLSLPSNSTITAAMYASNGQLIRQLADNQTVEAGINNLQFATNGLPAGVYYVRLAVNGEWSVHKLVKTE